MTHPANPPRVKHTDEPVIVVQGVCTRFGDKVIHDGLDLTVQQGEILAIVGGSGSGKSTLLREMILLHRPQAGNVRVLGVDLALSSPEQALQLRQRWGVMFQHGGLFAALTVLENIGLPLREHRQLTSAEVDHLAIEKMAMSGLPLHVGAQYPASLSGGMLKRASMARALVLDPELLFLDEPTAGLDPESADGVDELILALHQKQGLTVVMVTHDLDLLWHVCDRVAVLADGRVQGVGSMQALSQMQHPGVKRFFTGTRAGNALALAHHNRMGGPAWKPR